MNWKLAIQLRQRGFRDATSVYELGLGNRRVKDGQLIKRLAHDYEPCVLVVWDHKLPTSHRQELDHFALTVAQVDRHGDHGGRDEEEYYREVIHREAHRMAAQGHGSIWKYSLRPRRLVKAGVNPPPN